MATQHDRAAIAAQLSLLEQELKELELWGGAERRPSAEELASSLPFAMDTLEFHQWLEYILIERLHTQLEKVALQFNHDDGFAGGGVPLERGNRARENPDMATPQRLFTARRQNQHRFFQDQYLSWFI